MLESVAVMNAPDRGEEAMMRVRAELLRVPYEDILDFAVLDAIAALIHPD